MDENAKKKKSVTEESSLGTSERKKKKKHQELKKQHGTDKTFDPNKTVDGNCIDEAGEIQVCSVEEKLTSNRVEEGDISKRKKKKRTRESEVINSNIVDGKVTDIFNENQKSKMKKRKNGDDSLTGLQEMGGSKPSKKGKMTWENDFNNNEGDRLDRLLDGISMGNANTHSLVNKVEDQGKMEKKKKLGEKSKRSVEGSDSSAVNQSIVAEEVQGKEVEKVLRKKKKRTEDEDCKTNEGEDDDQGKKMKKRKSDKFRSKESDEVDDQGKKKMKTKKKTKAGTGDTLGGTSKPKRVTFSDEVEVCCDGLTRGKRFTPEEDETVKEAVLNYVESHALGDQGLDMILHCRSHPEVRHCWKEIGLALPHRPYTAVYYRAHILFERSEERKWTPEELDFVRKVQEQHGSDWKSIAEALGKNRFHVKDAWRRIKNTERNTGSWKQEEYQQLFDLVNMDLRARSLEETRKRKHGMLRDNIPWEAIGTKFVSRQSANCCKKWYAQLTSPMVKQGIWSDTDDYRLINALFVLDACCMEEVDWDYLLEHRDGDVCRKRWEQMVQHIGEHGTKSFAEQVEILVKRYCPDLLEAREAFDSKPVVC